MGPMAEDFSQSFGLGTDEKYLSTVDVDGVALASIQGLYRLVQELQGEVRALRSEVELLRGSNGTNREETR